MNRTLPVTRRTAFVIGSLVFIETALIVAWFSVGDWTVLRSTAVAHPFVWINVGVYAILRVDVPVRNRRVHTLAAGIAALYLIGLSWYAGMITAMTGSLSAEILWLPPGWGPALTVTTPIGSATIFPYQGFGFLTLAWLLYAALLSTVRSSVGAVLGFATCIGCSVPAVTGLLVTIFGGASPLAFGGGSRPAAIGTATFLLAVALLLWRPSDPA